MLKTFLILGSITLFFGCSSTGKIPVNNDALDDRMSERMITISISAVEPMMTQAMSQIAASGLLQPGNNISRIDVAGQGYFIKIKGDSVSARLPYYGERQMGGGYNADAGIVFEGLTKNLEINKSAKNNSYTIAFSIRDASEQFKVTTLIGTSWNTSTAIQSSNRNRIRYLGLANKNPNAQ